jgi:tRNA threonylcarbamoyladenosine biosynthesis protein TsaE
MSPVTEHRPPGAAILVPGSTQMRDLGARLALLLRPGDLIVLAGPLGAGKTTMVQGIGAGLGVRGPITSPTFVIARVHPSLRGGPDLVHADAYRLGSRLEVDDLDLDADLDHSVTVVEWGAGLVEALAPAHLLISIAWDRRDEPAVADGDRTGGSLPDRDPDGGDAAGEPADEARLVTLAGSGERWAAMSGDLADVIAGLRTS